jgi:hypothetical protein
MFLLWSFSVGPFVSQRGFPLLANTGSRAVLDDIQDKGADMSDLEQLNRILYQHKWRSLQDWVTTLDELADLSDDEIEEIQRLHLTAADSDPRE